MPVRTTLTAMRWQRRRAILIACLAFYARSASAQVTMGVDPLSIPKGTLLCHSVRTDPADSTAFLFQYIDGNDSIRKRLSMIGFDSVGTPLYMMVSAPAESARGERLTYVFTVQFFPKAQGGRLISFDEASSQIEGEKGADSVAHRKPIEETLTDAEVAHARVLAEWFWIRRCEDAVAEK